MDCPRAGGFVASCIRSALDQWRAIGASDNVCNWIAHGYPLKGARALAPVERNNHASAERDHPDFVRAEIQKLLRTGAIREVARSEVHIVCALSVVPKKTGTKLRLIWDGRPTNKGLYDWPFKYETLEHVAAMLRQGWYMFTIDLESGYHHCPVAACDWRYMGFQFDGRYYVYTVLPFGTDYGLQPAFSNQLKGLQFAGLKHSPVVFTKTMRQVVNYFRRLGIFLVNYVDDWWFAAPTFEAACNLRDFVLATFARLKLVVNSKSELTPSQRVSFLGFIVDSSKMLFEVPMDKLKRLVALIKHLLNKKKKSASAREMAKVAGTLVSMARGLAPARIKTRALFRYINIVARDWHWNHPVQLTVETRRELQWWLANINKYNGRCPIRPARLLVLTTDASHVGAGAWITTRFGDTQPLAWDLGPAPFQCLWTAQESQMISSWRELMAVLRAMQHYREELRNQNILVRSDNTVTVAYINNGGGRHEYLCRIAAEIWDIALRQCVSIEAEHIPGVDNEWSDALSRYFFPADYSLKPAYFRWVSNVFGHFDVDRMASAANAHLRRYFTVDLSDRRAEGYDCFTVTWRGARNYVFPDPNIILHLVSHIRQCGASAVLIVPQWPSAPWWPQIQLALRAPMLVLGPAFDVCERGPLSAQLPSWILVAVHVSWE